MIDDRLVKEQRRDRSAIQLAHADGVDRPDPTCRLSGRSDLDDLSAAAYVMVTVPATVS